MEQTEFKYIMEDMEILKENIFIEDINEWDKFCDDIEGGLI